MRIYYTEEIKAQISTYPEFLEKKFSKFANDEAIKDILPFETIEGINLFKARLSIKARIIFTHVKLEDELITVVLELLPEHEYDHSNLLSGNKITIEKLKEQLEQLKVELKKEQVEQQAASNNNNFYVVNLDQLEYAKQVRHLKKFIQLDEKQEEATEYNLPLVINGSAGSGKTSVALEKLKKLEGDVLYITLSKQLARESEVIYGQSANEQQKVNFLCLDEFLKSKTNTIENKQPITRKVFSEWFNNQCKKQKFKEYKLEENKIFEEFTGVISGMDSSEEDYIDSGQAESVFNKEQRVGIYNFYTEYRKHFLNSNDYYDPNLVLKDIKAAELNPGKKYHAIIVDEMQDFTFITLKYVLQQLREENSDQFLLCGDTNQIIHPTFFSVNRLEKFFNQVLAASYEVAYFTLTKNHRNSEAVTKVANNILRFKNTFFGTEEKLSKAATESFFTTSNTKTEGNVSLIDQGDVAKLSNDIAKSADWAVIVFDNNHKQEAEKLFNTPLVFTVEEIKGLEFNNIILYITQNSYRATWTEASKNNKISPSAIRDQLVDENWSARSSKFKNKENKSFKNHEYVLNKLYVAFTRAVENIYIFKEGNNSLWQALAVGENTGNSTPINVVTSTIEEFTDKIIEIIRAGQVSKAREVVKQNIITQASSFKLEDIEQTVNKISSELAKLPSQKYNDDPATEKTIVEFQLELKNFTTKLHNVNENPVIASSAKASEEGKAKHTGVLPKPEKGKTKSISVLPKPEKGKTKSTSVLPKPEKGKTKSTSVLPKPEKGEAEFQEEVRSIIAKLCSNLQNIEEITAKQLEQTYKASKNKTLFSALIYQLPIILDKIEASTTPRDKEANKNLLIRYINKVNSRALNDQDDSGKSALDYLVEYKNDKGKLLPNILSRMSPFISSNIDCLKQFLNAAGDNIFRLDAKNWPVLSYFRNEELNLEDVKKYVKGDIAKYIWSNLAGKYDPCGGGLVAIMHKPNPKLTQLGLALKFMLERGANVNGIIKGGFTPLNVAIKNGYGSVIKMLLENGADVELANLDNSTPLHIAAYGGCASVIEMLLEKGANIEASNNDSFVPLHIAAYRGHASVVEMLLEKGANIEASDNEGRTSLHMAAESGHISVIKILSRANVDIDRKTAIGLTSLHIAIHCKHAPTVKALLGAGANIEKVDGYQNTPLNLAAMAGDKSVVKLLLDAGADKEARDEVGATPIHSSVKHTSITELLLKGGADREAKSNDGATPLHIAAQGGHESTIKVLLDAGAKIEASDNEGRTPLHIAVKYGYESTIKVLLDTGAKIEASDNEGRTPLHIAAENGHGSVIKMLLEEGANIEAKSNEGATPLHTAAENGHGSVIEMLLEEDANIEARSNVGDTPLHWAALNDHGSVIEMLLEKGANIEAKSNVGRTPLHIAAENGHGSVIKMLLEKGAKIEASNNKGRTSLHLAAQGGYESTIKVLLDAGAKIEASDNEGRTPLHIAAENGHGSVIKMLLEEGANIEAKSNECDTPLHWAAENGHGSVIKMLLEEGANIEAKSIEGDTPLHIAAENGHGSIIEMLLEEGANIEAKSNGGVTPLHWAALNDHGSVIKMLLEEGANIEAKSNEGSTPLHIAAENGHGSVIKMLLEEGANIEAKSNGGVTPLHWAALNDHGSVIKMLLEEGANIEAKSNEGSTPLHIAAENGHGSVIKMLLEEGANIEAKSNGGVTPLHIAAKYGHESAVKVLIEAGADGETLKMINKDIIDLKRFSS